MIQCKEQWCEFLQDFHIQREILLSVSPDEDENEGFISHDQVPVHERRTILLHVVSPSFDRFFIVGAISKHESILPEFMQGQESDLVRVRCVAFRYESAVPEDATSACVRAAVQPEPSNTSPSVFQSAISVCKPPSIITCTFSSGIFLLKMIFF